MSELELMLRDYRLTTAEILYHMPDHPGVLQTFVWQDYDLAPEFPVLGKFVQFWQRKIHGKLHSVTVATVGLVQPTRYHHAQALYTLQ